jgi:hypothetical protein
MILVINSLAITITKIIKPSKQEQERQMKSEFPIEKLEPFMRVTLNGFTQTTLLVLRVTNSGVAVMHTDTNVCWYVTVDELETVWDAPDNLTNYCDTNYLGDLLWQRPSQAQLEAMKAYEEAKQRAKSLGCELE